MSVSWLWLVVPVGIACMAIVWTLVGNLIAIHRTVVVRAPLVAEQEVSLEAAGRMLLHAEGPRFTRAFGGLDFRLTRREDEFVVPLQDVWFRAESSGRSTSRLSLRSFELERPGRYRLRVLGLPEPLPEKPHALVVTHDYRARMVRTIVALVFAGIGLIGSVGLTIVIFLLNR
jgi:hypothetical protein